MKKVTQNEAVLYRLMKSANQWVPMPELVNFTAEWCASGCYAIHSRAPELRKLGYDVQNEMTEVNGVKQSCYRLNIKPAALQSLKAKFTLGEPIPAFNQLKEFKPRGVQASMFGAEKCVV